MTDTSYERAKTALRWALIALYGAAGVVHLVAPEKFLPIVPDWVPFPRETVLATGLCEIAGALALMTRGLRKAAGIAFALYAIAVFPANIKHAFMAVDVPTLPLSWWYHGPRLLAQPVLVWAALFCTDVIRWPARARQETKDPQ